MHHLLSRVLSRSRQAGACETLSLGPRRRRALEERLAFVLSQSACARHISLDFAPLRRSSLLTVLRKSTGWHLSRVASHEPGELSRLSRGAPLSLSLSLSLEQPQINLNRSTIPAIFEFPFFFFFFRRTLETTVPMVAICHKVATSFHFPRQRREERFSRVFC